MRRFIAIICCCVSLFCVLVFSSHSAGQQGPEINPPGIETAKEIKLPAKADDIVVGGDGRYILYLFRSLQKIGVFDVNEAELTHFIPMPDAECKVAAGRTKMLIVHGNSISRYDIASGKKELTSAFQPSGTGPLLLGSASQGPAFLSGKPTQIIDLVTLKTSSMEAYTNHAPQRISADGETLICWRRAKTSTQFERLVRSGQQWLAGETCEASGVVLPSSDGKRIFTRDGIYTGQLQRLVAPRFQVSVPAIHGPLYLGVQSKSISVYIRDQEETLDRRHRSSSRLTTRDALPPLATLPASTSDFKADTTTGSSLTLEKKVIFVPNANLLIQLSKNHDSLLLRSFDAKQALAKSDVNYLFIQSNPPSVVAAGESFEYQIEAVSKADGVSYSLDSAPAGMSVSESGLVTWPTSQDSPPKNSIIASITNQSKKTLFHTFEVSVTGGVGDSIPPSSRAEFTAATDVSIQSPPISSEEYERKVKLPDTISRLVVGGGGRFLLVHFRGLGKIGLFDVAVAKFTKYFPTSSDNILLAAGANHLVVVNQDQGIVSRYNLTTHQRELVRPVPFAGKITSVGMGNNSYGPMMAEWLETTKATTANLGLINLKTLAKSKTVWAEDSTHDHNWRYHNEIFTSNDGQHFLLQYGNRITAENWRISGNQIKRSDSPLLESGRYFAGASLPRKTKGHGISVPALDGPFYIKLESAIVSRRDNFGDAPEASGKAYLYNDTRPVGPVKDLKLAQQPPNNKTTDILGWKLAKNLIILQKAKLIVSVGPSLDSLVMRHFDFEAGLKSSGIDYLMINSSPPATSRLSQNYEYQIETLSKNGGLVYTLESGPAGMTISPQGKIEWTPSEAVDASDQNVIVKVVDSAGQEIFHTFAIDISNLGISNLGEVATANKKLATEEALRLELEKKRLAEMEQKVAQKAAQGRERERQQTEMAKKFEAMEALAARRRKEILERTQGTAAASAAEGKTEYSTETWTDSTGKHNLEGKFVEISDESIVLLELKDGTKKPIPLARLTGQHSYRAVMYDIQGLEQKTPETKATDSGRTAFTIEKWTDASGKHDLEGAFQEIRDLSKVILKAKDGSERELQLHILTSKHIYRAVKHDAQRLGISPKGVNKPPSDPPNQEPLGNSKISAENVREIVLAVERMIILCKNETSPEAFLQGMLSPASLVKLKGSSGFDSLLKRFQDGNVKRNILEGLLALDFTTAAPNESGTVSFKRSDNGRSLRFDSSNGTWYLMN